MAFLLGLPVRALGAGQCVPPAERADLRPEALPGDRFQQVFHDLQVIPDPLPGRVTFAGPSYVETQDLQFLDRFSCQNRRVFVRIIHRSLPESFPTSGHVGSRRQPNEYWLKKQNPPKEPGVTRPGCLLILGSDGAQRPLEPLSSPFEAG